MKQQLHRSLIFWSGIFVMIFIAWGWWDSFQATSSVAYRYRVIRNADAGVMIGSHPGGGTSVFQARRSETKLVHPPWSPCPGPFFVRGSGGFQPEWDDYKQRREATQSAHQRYLLLMHSEPASDWVLFIPHWLVILLFAIPWSLMLVWRARRRRVPVIEPVASGLQA